MSDKVYIETYGCQMNIADSEIVANILQKNNYIITQDVSKADIIMLNTCSIRDNAEQRIVKRVKELQHLRKKHQGLKLGIIGCMAERIGEALFNEGQQIQFLAGPDSYRNITNIIEQSDYHNVSDIILSNSETYDDILPQKLLTHGITSFVPIMRGCENFCSYCVVPYTRGKERSRSAESIINEIHLQVEANIKEITLLGQNVNSYNYVSETENISFFKLLDTIASMFPTIRFRFATSHPKDISDDLLYVIASHKNICKSIHLPLQSGSNGVLDRMNRGYSSEWYLSRTEAIQNIIPECSISTDIITGFCGETEQDHLQTMEVMKKVGFFHAFMFKYSERSGTAAAKRFSDDVPDTIKSSRLEEIIALQQSLSLQHNQNDIHKTFDVLIESHSKRDTSKMMGRTSHNKVVVFPAVQVVSNIGDTVLVRIEKCSSATLQGNIVLDSMN
jgi:tRNA-2-methylthio-N6-dimethylallyladenosine synthase